ncbi:DUF1996 domain-containing protein [Terrabacter sp. BE26]|uniref:DUF1996 domain-containing protein n=1 Tax=Terrabacter sp. BE26 TaxID=2898152 RepID=UPI0035BE7D50
MSSSLHRLLATLCTAAVLFATGATLAPSPAQALAKVPCKPGVGIRQVDPIVARGSATSAHLHEFFGNKALLNLAEPHNATYDQLVGQATACTHPGDSAAYWAPGLLVNGKLAPAGRFVAYYRSFDHKDIGAAQPFPADLRMVTAKYSWSCNESSTIVRQLTIPDCSTATGTTVRLTVHYTFPSCWDGKRGDHTTPGNTADFAPSGVTNHLAFFTKSASGTSCPAGYPIKLPELLENVSWGDGTPGYWAGKQLRLTSDGPADAPGATSHADFLQSWEPAALTTMVAHCINVAPPSTGECG